MILRKVGVFHVPIRGGVAWIPKESKIIGQIKDEQNRDRLVIVLERNKEREVDDPIFEERW